MNLDQSSKSILIVEDDTEVGDVLGHLLKEEGYSTELALCGTEAFRKIKEKEFDLILVERILPEVSGLDFIRNLRQFKNTPVLLLTTQAEPEDILSALDAGASDYLQKPFERNCILNRVRSLLRRSGSDESARNGRLMMGELTIDTHTFDVFSGAQRVQLTPSEFKLLHALALHRGAVLTREKLIELVQGQGIAVIDRAIDTHIFGLRKKLGSCAEIVETVRGVGYRIGS